MSLNFTLCQDNFCIVAISLTFVRGVVVDVPEYCAANPTDVLPDPDNCAHFFDCNKKTTMVHRAAHIISVKTFTKECPYPDLFDYNSRQCMTFTSVDCRTRPEPMIPCKYNLKETMSFCCCYFLNKSVVKERVFLINHFRVYFIGID